MGGRTSRDPASSSSISRRVQDRRAAEVIDTDGVVEVILVRGHVARGKHRDVDFLAEELVAIVRRERVNLRLRMVTLSIAHRRRRGAVERLGPSIPARRWPG
jgi:microsomal dipeptidase-like Zn-dependent dipeptidase